MIHESSSLAQSLLCCVLVLGGILTASTAPSFPEVSQLPIRTDLPDPLVMLDGRRVTTREQWVEQRRPELKALFAHYMYGHMPPAQPRFEVGTVDKNFFGGKATRKLITIKLTTAAQPELQLLLVVPNRRTGPAPAFVGLNFCGNHALVNDHSIPLTEGWMPQSCAGCTNNRATDAARGTQVDTWALEQSIDRGYAVAVYYNGDVEPDRPDAPEGVARLTRILRLGGSRGLGLGSLTRRRLPGDRRGYRREAHRRGRTLSKRQSGPARRRNGSEGSPSPFHSRRVAAARRASRSKIGESVQQINDHFPHWFNAEFKKFNAQPDRLPFDQHCLIALCAPRPVLLPNAVEDQWANPSGQFRCSKQRSRFTDCSAPMDWKRNKCRPRESWSTARWDFISVPENTR